MDDTDMLDLLDDECWDAQCKSSPNADAGDYSIWWEIREHRWGGDDVLVGRGDSLREAIFDATLEHGDVRRHDYAPAALRQEDDDVR